MDVQFSEDEVKKIAWWFANWQHHQGFCPSVSHDERWKKFETDKHGFYPELLNYKRLLT